MYFLKGFPARAKANWQAFDSTGNYSFPRLATPVWIAKQEQPAGSASLTRTAVLPGPRSSVTAGNAVVDPHAIADSNIVAHVLHQGLIGAILHADSHPVGIGLLLVPVFQFVADIGATRYTDHGRCRIAFSGADLVADKAADHCACKGSKTDRTAGPFLPDQFDGLHDTVHRITVAVIARLPVIRRLIIAITWLVHGFATGQAENQNTQGQWGDYFLAKIGQFHLLKIRPSISSAIIVLLPRLNQDGFRLKDAQLFIGLFDLIADHAVASTQADGRQYTERTD